MKLNEYFQNASGTGVLSTADSSGKVDSAIYAKPHITAEGLITFIMRDRLTYHNLEQNPYAAYLFIEKGGSYKGVRLFLKKVKENTDSELLREMTRRCLSPEEDEARGPKFLVYFEAETILELIGSVRPEIELV